MAKVKGPLLSLGASGQVAQSQVYASWRGVDYVRQFVTPANPNTLAQQQTRNVFAALMQQFVYMGQYSRQPWQLAAERKPLTDRNALTKVNLPLLRGDPDMADWMGSGGAKGGLPLKGVTTTGAGAAGEIELDCDVAPLPTGWQTAHLVGQAVHDRDPSIAPSLFVGEATIQNPPADQVVTIAIPGLITGDIYNASAWMVYQKPDGGLAVGASVSAGLVPAQ